MATLTGKDVGRIVKKVREHGKRPDLNGVDFSDADLSDTDLSRADLS